MNGYLLTAGLIASLPAFGHIVFGEKWFLAPMLASDFETIAKKQNQCVFHYLSVFMVLAAFVLVSAGAGLRVGVDLRGCIWLIAACYAGFALVQIAVAATSTGVSRWRFFQWPMFLAVAVLSWLGS